MKRAWITGVLAAAALAAGAWAEQEGAFPLVDGDRQAVIVGSDDLASCVENGYTSIRGFLRKYVKQSTGRELARTVEKDYDAAEAPFAVFMPDTRASRERHAADLKGLDRDAYVIEVTPKAVYLSGARPHSGGYAMVDFLYRATGAATYIPSKWGTIVPRRSAVRLAVGKWVEAPAYESRALSALRTWKDGERINYGANAEIPWRLYRRDQFGHNLHTFIPVAEFGKSHPEYFAEVNGKRMIVSSGTGPGPCISNPEVVEIVIRKARAFFDDPKNADCDIISLGMTDGGWCDCAACRAMDGPDVNGSEKSKSARYIRFLNQVARALGESHPGKSVGAIAYAGADWPPRDVAVERNIVPYICLTRANWGDPAVREAHMRQTREWASRVDKIGVYEYLYGAGFMVPRLYSGFLADYLRAAQDMTRRRGFYAEIYSNHALDGPKAWIAEKLAWNPRQDPAQLRAVWAKAVFEEAAGPMEAYFAFLEACNARNVTRCPVTPKPRESKFYLLQNEGQFELFTPEEMAAARARLEEAAGLTKRPEILERIRYFADGLTVAEESVRAYHAYGKAKAAFAAGAAPGEVLAALVEGDAKGPRVDPVELMRELNGRDASMFTDVMPVAISSATEMSMRLVDGGPWGAVRRAVAQGEQGRERLVELAQDEVRKMAPAGWEKGQCPRVDMLLAMASRIAVARKASQAPVIDGVADEAVWAWQEDSPWWSARSGIPFAKRARFAFCHDGRTLYAAFQGHLDGLDKARKCEGYGVAAWKYISVEFFLNPDGSDKYFQCIPALGGGLYCSAHEVVAAWKVTNTDTMWQAELAIDLGKIGMAPSDCAALRLNMQHNAAQDGHYAKGWFPSSFANKDGHSRGWLVFGR
ncbi:MAG TPA: DUF4838 domain-containing protein [Candidatus Brocadiia bacterium]|nr:DUF4838 domain-containing protein [Candidatus Brocadiia bacterium]